MTVLYEFHRQAQFTKLIRAECLHEKASGIAKNLGNDHNYMIQMNRFNLERHRGFRSSSPGIPLALAGDLAVTASLRQPRLGDQDAGHESSSLKFSSVRLQRFSVEFDCISTHTA